MKRIVIVGATSGIGYEVARAYCKLGYKVGVAGRREDLLDALCECAPKQFEKEVIDVISPNADAQLLRLIEKLGGMDIFLLSSGVGRQNPDLNFENEMVTIQTNTLVFSRMVVAAYHYFEKQGQGQLAIISSIAGTKGIGIAASYSATKRFQNTYIDGLAQLARMQKKNIRFTDIRPGFVQTAILKDRNYPMLMRPEVVASHIVRAIAKQKRRVVIDWRYAWLVRLWNLIPSALWERISLKNK